ncbi:MAG TPA: VanW family protein [Kofleriaceae bacterium]|nr:VanW family protein [Kofleriaceae bacterium]
MNRPMYARSRTGSMLIGAGSLVLLVGGVMLIAYFVQEQDAAAGSSTPPAAAPVEPKSVTAPQAKPAEPPPAPPATGALATAVTLKFDGRTFGSTWAELGVVEGEGGGLSVDRARAEQALLSLKRVHDRAPFNARMDLEARVVHKEKPGWGIDVYASISAIEAAVRAGSKELELEGAPIPASIGVKELGIEDISVVLGHFESKFAIAEKSRNDNLKLLASHMDGLVIQPGQEISFNEISGDRTEKEGYKVAHVIEAGEMVDGMAGGACQISTTMHGAAFFAGLDVLSTTPHSRPSTYVPLGFDSTVVYPATDLKLRNPYDFPVAVYYRVARGEAYVEILGKEKPFDKVEFVREVVEQKPFETVTREDSTIALGHMVIDQPGYPGYKLFRYRNIYKDGKVIKKNKWTINYKPVVEYVRRGINPDPNLPAPKAKASHMPKPAKGSVFKMAQ